MQDAIFLLLIAAFFAVAWLLVKGCERIMGPELELIEEPTGETTPMERAA